MEVTVTVRPLAELEAVIEAGLTAFVQVGEALLAIREHRMYRETHDSFEAYCRERFNFNRQRASQLIEAAEVSRILDTAPVRASHAEALAPLKEDPEAVREVYAEVQAQTSGSPTAADYGAAVDRRLGIGRPQPTRRALDPDISDDYVEDVNQDPEWTPPSYTPEAWAYEQATSETPAPISLDDLADERDDDGSVARARLLAQYSTGIAAACKVVFLNAEAVVGALGRERRLIHRENARTLRAWLDAVDIELDRAAARPLQVVGGSRG